jgi:RimJ/RimL family protein N-acetyltransferase
MRLGTEHLILRPVAAADLDDLVRLHADPAVREVFGDVDAEEVREWLGRAEAEWAERGHGRLAVLDRANGAFLGRSGLRHWPEFDEVEVSWALVPEARGRGLATEAGSASLAWGFELFDDPYLTAMIDPANAASIAVAERLGMERLREDVLHGDPVLVYAAHRDAARRDAGGATP